MSRGFQKFWNTLTSLLVVLVVLLAIALAGVRVIGFTPFSVLSGSMEPTYHVGAIIYVQKTAPENIKVGDPITFVMNEELTVATHRVVRIDTENQRFYTKGDANDAEDGAPVHFNNLLGKPVFTIPYLGYFSDWIANPPGMYIGITAGIVLLLLLFLPDLLKKADEADKNAAEEKKQQQENKTRV